MWHSTCQASMYSKTWPRTRGAGQWWIGSDCPAWRTSLGRGNWFRVQMGDKDTEPNAPLSC